MAQLRHITGVKRNTAYTYATMLEAAAGGAWRANPTLAGGDAKVDLDGAGFNNLGTTPAVAPAGGRRVNVVLTAGEMNAAVVTIQFVDAAGAEWLDDTLVITTTPVEAALANAVAHGGTTASLALASVVVSNGAGNAVLFESTGGGGSGLSLQGEGSGAGVLCVGGSGGANGIDIFGGSGGGTGMQIAAQNNSNGVTISGDTNGHGMVVSGGSDGEGVLLESGFNAGAGLHIVGNATPIPAMFVEHTNDGAGFRANGSGDFAGMELVGGNSFNGLGHGLHAHANTGGGGGHGILAEGEWDGVTPTDGFHMRSSGGGHGMSAVVVIGDGHGIHAEGGQFGGAGDGFNVVGGELGAGIRATGGFTGGDGINSTAVGYTNGGVGMRLTGVGATDAHGLIATAGDSGAGIRAIAGVAGGAGLHANSQFSGAPGIFAEAGSDAPGMKAIGNGNGPGLECEGGFGFGNPPPTYSHGIYAHTAVSGALGRGIYAEGQAGGAQFVCVPTGDGPGLELDGDGAGAGLLAGGGVTGSGLHAVGGATSGDGLRAEATTAGNGITAHGGATSGDAINADAVGNGTALNLFAAGANPTVDLFANTIGVRISNGTGPGVLVNGGSAGIEISAASGAGVSVSAGTDSTGVSINGDGIGHGIEFVGGVTGHGAKFLGGATSGDGLRAEATTGGAGMTLLGVEADGLFASASGSTGNGINASGVEAGMRLQGSEGLHIQTNLTSETAVFVQGGGDAPSGIVVTGGIDVTGADTGDALLLTAKAGSNGAGLKGVGDGTGFDIDAPNNNLGGGGGMSLSDIVEGVFTVQDTFKLANAANAGKVSGMATPAVLIRDLSDSLDRVTAAVDSVGNRTAITLDLS